MIDREAFQHAFDVSRETMAMLDRYAELLAEWQANMNLVGPSTLPLVWHRHHADSAQLLPIAGRGRSWLDVGAGAGFPGLVVAIFDPDSRLTLVESIAKKCRFLNAVVEALGLRSRVTVENRRIETLPPQRFDVVTARALASLGQVIDWCLPYAQPDTCWILPKGVRVADELALAQRRFAFDHQLVTSMTDPDARIVVAANVRRR